MPVPGPGYAITARVEAPASASVAGDLTVAIGQVGGVVTAFDVVESHTSTLVVDISCNALNDDHGRAITEALDLKREIFGKLDTIVRPDAILATNTSSLSVTELSVATGRPSRVIGMHFFNPAPAMKLVEVNVGLNTPDSVAEKKLDPSDKTLDRDAVDAVMNELDEYAVEEALKLKEAHGGEVTVLTMGPGKATETLVYKVYNDGFVNLVLGDSAAQSVVLMVIVIALTAVQFRYVERKVHYG